MCVLSARKFSYSPSAHWRDSNRRHTYNTHKRISGCEPENAQTAMKEPELGFQIG
jgi:hypothetical protein